MSQPTCLVKSCRSLSPGGTPTPLFLIPSGFDSTGQKQDHLIRRRNSWISSLTKRSTLSEDQLRNGRVCGRHFITGRPSKEDLENDPDWIPNQALHDEWEEEFLDFVVGATGTGTSVNVIQNTRGKARCCACKSRMRKEDGRFLISYHLFPQKQEIRNAWLKFVNKKEGDLPNCARLCTRHFTEDQTIRMKNRVKLKKNAVPTLLVPKQKYTGHLQFVTTATIPHLKEITIKKNTKNIKLTDPISSTLTIPVSPSAAAELPPGPESGIDPLYFPFVTVKEERLDRDYESPEFVTESDLREITKGVDFQPVRVKEEVDDACETSNNDLIEVKHEPLYREIVVGGEPVNGDLIGDDVSRSPIKGGVSSSERVDVNQTAVSKPRDFIKETVLHLSRKDLGTLTIQHDHPYCSKIQRRRPKKKIYVPSTVKLQDNHFYKCSFCSYCTAYKAFLVSHLNQVHCHEENDCEPDENGRTWQPGSRIFCPYCQNTFRNEDVLMQHMLIQHLINTKLVREKIVPDVSTSGTVYKCPHCLLRSTDRDKLTEHIKKKHCSSYRCSECAYMCDNQKTLLQHSKAHYKGYKFFRCAECLELQTENLMGKHQCKSISQLSKPSEEEMKKQLKEKMSKLKAHWNVRWGIFECPGCNYTIIKEDSFKEHLLALHTKVLLRFYCNLCMFHSHRKYDVDVHRQNTHKTSKMEQILNNTRNGVNDASASVNDANANNANTVVSKKKPLKREFKCRFCAYTTKLRFYLNQHMKQQHLLGKPSPIVIKSDKILIKKKPSGSLPPTKTPLSQDKISPERPIQALFEDYIKVVILKKPDFMKGDPESTKKLTMYSCGLCTYYNHCKEDTEKHLKLKHTYNEVTYSCTFCDLKTKYKSHLQKHLNSKHLQELIKEPEIQVKVVSVMKMRKDNQFEGSKRNKLIRMKKKPEVRVKSVGVGRRKRVSKPPDRLDL